MRSMLPLRGLLPVLTPDGRVLFAARIVRLFANGNLSVILVLYLAQLALSQVEIGLVLTLTLLGDTAISLWITTSPGRLGRRKMLILGVLRELSSVQAHPASGT